MNQELINQINQYLKGNSSYTLGCSLFYSLTTNKQFAIRLMRNDSAVNRETLSYELQKIIDKHHAEMDELIIDTTPLPPTPPKEILPVANSLVETTPNDIEYAIREDWKGLYRHRGHLHGRLHEATNEESRHEIAKQIMSTQKQIDLLNLELEKLKGGAIPLRFLENRISAESYRKIQNLKAYIRRDQFKLNTDITTSERKKLLANIQKYEEKIKHYGKN